MKKRFKLTIVTTLLTSILWFSQAYANDDVRYPCGQFGLSDLNKKGKQGVNWSSDVWGRDGKKTIVKADYQAVALRSPYCYGLFQTPQNTVEIWSFSAKKEAKKVADLPYSQVWKAIHFDDLLIATRPAVEGEGYDVALVSAASGQVLATLNNISDKAPLYDGSNHMQKSQPFFANGGETSYVRLNHVQDSIQAYSWLKFNYANGETGLLGLIRPQGSPYVSKIIDFKNDVAKPNDLIFINQALQLKLGANGYFDLLNSGQTHTQGMRFSKIRLFAYGTAIGDVAEEFNADIFTQKPVDIARLIKLIEDHKHAGKKRAALQETTQLKRWLIVEDGGKLNPTPYKEVWNKPNESYDMYVQAMDGGWSQYRYPQYRAATLEALTKDQNISAKIQAQKTAHQEKMKADMQRLYAQDAQWKKQQQQAQEQAAYAAAQKERERVSSRPTTNTSGTSSGARALSSSEKDYYDNIGNQRNPYEIKEKK